MSDKPDTIVVKAERKGSNNRVVALSCVAFVAGMLGMSYAAVPLYQLFCQVTGFGGTTQVANSAPDRILDREITIRFDANISSDLPWEFAPEIGSVKVRVGEVRQINYQVISETSATTWGTASFNVTPDKAGYYFNKIACFCFNEQSLDSGQSIDMPIVFFVDPEIVNDSDLDHVDTITLSYTFYPSAPPEADTAEAPALNGTILDDKS